MHGRTLAKLPEAEDAGDAIDLRQLQDFFWRRWKLILATAAGVLALTMIVLLTVAPRYTSTAQVLLDPRKEKVFGAESILPELNLDTGNVDSQISVIQSINLLRNVVQREKLTQDKEFGLADKPGLLRVVLNLFSTPDEEPAAAPANLANKADIPVDVLRAIGRLRSALEVQRVNRTYVLSISVTSEDAVKAARLANAVADAYVVEQLEARYDTAKRASAWLAERMDTLRDQVRQSEEAVTKFRRDNNLVAMSSEGKVTISEQQLSELNGKLVAARAETAERRAKFEQAQQVQARGGNLQAIPDVVRSTVVSQLRTQQAEVARKEADLVARYSEGYPLVVNARAERRNIESSISNEVGRIISNLKNDYDVARARENSLQASLIQLTGATGMDNDVGIKLRELERANVANKTLFENFLSRSKITQEQSTLEERESRVISPATKPGFASFPKKPLVGSLAMIVGLMLGVGAAVALEMLNAGFTTPRQVEEKLGRAVLAAVPLLRDNDRKVDGQVLDPPRYLAAKPLSRYAEAVRAIRMGVQMADVDQPPKVLLMTSSIPQEGKSTLSISLAFSAAKAGQKVLIIDGDLRHPTVTKFFGLESRPGLVDLLAATATADESFVVIDGISVLAAGSKSQNPPDLLGSERMRGLVEHLRAAFDYIIIDSPPVGPVIDAKVLAALADKILFVVRWQSTTREVVGQNIESFIDNRKVAGVVLNLVDESKTPKYGPYSHYSGYYYQKYYQN